MPKKPNKTRGFLVCVLDELLHVLCDGPAAIRRPCYQTFLSVPIGFFPKGSYSQSDFTRLDKVYLSMATPAQLVETISGTTGVPLATVIDIDRKLTKAGLRTKGGRGFSAARMTPKDAAHLIMAMLAASQSNEAAIAVERYAHTRVDKERSSKGLFGAAALDDLAALSTQHDFITGLSAVIASATDGALFWLKQRGESKCPPRIEIFAFTRATLGRIRIAGLPNRKAASVEYLPIQGVSIAPMGSSGDLEQSRRITERTIFAIAELLSLEGGRERN
jgi:hypothetical protein